MHSIRLRRPWQVEPSDVSGRRRFRRRFNRPTGLASGQAVWLVIDSPEIAGDVWLNRQLLGPLSSEPPPVRFNIALHLQDRNEVVIEADLPHETAAQAGSLDLPDALSVCLEIAD